MNLRCYCMTEPRHDDKISLSLPDLDLEHEWDLDSLPWSSVPPFTREPETSLDPNLMQAIEGVVRSDKVINVHAAQAFLYLYLRLTKVGKR